MEAGARGPLLLRSCAPALQRRAGNNYLGAMPIFFARFFVVYPRPVSPRSVLADLKLHVLARSAASLGPARRIGGDHVHPSCGDSCSNPANPTPERQITYINTWMSDRKDSDIIRQQIKDLDTYETDLLKLQARWQKFADAAGHRVAQGSGRELARSATRTGRR